MTKRLKTAYYAEAYGAAPNRGPEQGLRNAARFLATDLGGGWTATMVLVTLRVQKELREKRR